MSTGQELPNLHDAVLERIELRWEDGLATIEVTLVPGGPFVITASGIRSFSMSRVHEWGPSVFINDAKLRAEGEHGNILEIEMQSGDTITLAADRLTVAEAWGRRSHPPARRSHRTRGRRPRRRSLPSSCSYDDSGPSELQLRPSCQVCAERGNSQVLTARGQVLVK
jgi:hypothetical protein